MVRFLAPRLDRRHGPKQWGVTVLVSQREGGPSVSTQWFKDEDHAWWFIEKSCKHIQKQDPEARPEVAIRRKPA
jgi:hypothetical protein